MPLTFKNSIATNTATLFPVSAGVHSFPIPAFDWNYKHGKGSGNQTNINSVCIKATSTCIL